MTTAAMSWSGCAWMLLPAYSVVSSLQAPGTPSKSWSRPSSWRSRTAATARTGARASSIIGELEYIGMEFKVISARRRLCDYERDISEVLHGFYER